MFYQCNGKKWKGFNKSQNLTLFVHTSVHFFDSKYRVVRTVFHFDRQILTMHENCFFWWYNSVESTNRVDQHAIRCVSNSIELFSNNFLYFRFLNSGFSLFDFLLCDCVADPFYFLFWINPTCFCCVGTPLISVC